jgi:hypothetical protein
MSQGMRDETLGKWEEVAVTRGGERAGVTGVATQGTELNNTKLLILLF